MLSAFSQRLNRLRGIRHALARAEYRHAQRHFALGEK